MNEKKQFYTLLKIPRRKLLIEHVSNYSHWGLLVTGLMTIFITLWARIFIVLHLPVKIMVGVCIVLVITFMIGYVKKPTIDKATDLYDEYVKEDRVKTALTYLHDDSVMSRLQRRDTLSEMKKQVPMIETRRVKLFHRKRALGILVLLSITTGLILLPNDVMKSAQIQEVDEKIAKETKREIEKLAIEKNEQLEDLKEKSKKMTGSEELLETLLEKEARLEKNKLIAQKDKQQVKELAKDVKQLNDLSAALDQADSEKLKQALEQLKEKLPSLSEQQQNELKNLVSQVNGKEVNSFSELSEEQLEEMLASLENQLEKLINNAQSINQVVQAQNQVQQLATSLHQNMSNAGLSNSNQLSFASKKQSTPNQGKGNGQQNQNSQPQSGQNQSPNGQGQNGNGPGTGQGNGSNGNGSGSGSGSGSGNGPGSGAGFGQGSRELTIPEKIDGNETIENDFGQTGDGNGVQQNAPEAPVLKGTIRPYEEVYGQYEQSYRESLDRMDLPTHLEDVVKDYFSELNPEGE